VVLKQDVLGRVKTPKARREQLLDEFERSGLPESEPLWRSGRCFVVHELPWTVHIRVSLDWIPAASRFISTSAPSAYTDGRIIRAPAWYRRAA